jgi:probable HAF family extracellular repeat protein
MTDLGALDGSYSEAYAISDAGEVTGTYQSASDEIRVFRWTRAQGMVDVGPSYADATDGATSLSTDINSVGQIVGGVQPPGQQVRAAVRQPTTGAWQELMPDWPFVSFALGVNNRGVIVGRVHPAEDIDVPSQAAVWTPVPSVVGAGSPR